MKNFKKNKAQSIVEYALITAMVAIVAVVVLSNFGKTITNVGNKTNATVSNVSDNASLNYCKSISCTGYSNGECTGCPNGTEGGTEGESEGEGSEYIGPSS